MAQVVVLLIGLNPDVLDLSGVPAADTESARAAIQERIERNLATLRRLGYVADFCGTATEEKPAADLLLTMMRAKRYNGIVFGADIRLSVPHTRLLERLLNLAQVTSPDTVIVFDVGWDDTVPAVRRWFTSWDDG
ncbi:hypothetical protein [Beijerinckia sp. L45]|uniref:hypothetical protein n=1 Tax=Beijerinckia sp. L45 TaxID=1641855 RepID=UPI00131A71E7|nr:hypothetical protein [Beijerinckia sp. L45]